MDDEIKCPRCGDNDPTVSHIDGLICEECGCWFDYSDSGELLYAYDHIPASIDVAHVIEQERDGE